MATGMRKRRRPAGSGRRSKASAPSARSTQLLHLRSGWLMLALFGCLGMLLESFHGFKLSFYVAEDVQSRRLCWMVAHGSGVLLGLLHICFAASVARGGFQAVGQRIRSSHRLLAASIAIPVGFFLAGLFAQPGSLGSGIVVVYVGFTLLLIALWTTARSSPS